MALITQKAYAKRLKVTPQRINFLVKSGVIKLVKGKIDPELADKALRENEHPAFPSKAFGNGLTKHDAQVELIFYKMKLAELDYRKRRGELLEAAVARHEWSKVIMLIVSRLDGLPSKVGPLLVGQPLPEIVTTLQQYINDLRYEISDPATYGRKKKQKKEGAL